MSLNTPMGICVRINIFNKVNVFNQSWPPSKVFQFAKCTEKMEPASGFQLTDHFGPGRLCDGWVYEKQSPWKPETRGPRGGGSSVGPRGQALRAQRGGAPSPLPEHSPRPPPLLGGMNELRLLEPEGSFSFPCRRGSGRVSDLPKVLQSDPVTDSQCRGFSSTLDSFILRVKEHQSVLRSPSPPRWKEREMCGEMNVLSQRAGEIIGF